MFSFFKANPAPAANQARIIALMNQKGGVGKTTMAFNLAHAFAHQGKKVLCIDMDPQANFSSLFDIPASDDRKNIHHLLINSVKELKALHTSTFLNDVIIKTDENIDLIPSGQELSGFELTVAGINAPRQLILKKFIEKFELRSQYDVIIIDGPPTLGLLVVNILCATDGVLYPFVPDRFSEQGLKNIQQVVADIAEMEITSTPKNLGYIPNLFDTRRKQASTDLEHIKETLGEATMHEAFTNKVQFGKSLAQRKSVFHFKSNDFKDLQRQFVSMTEAVSKELN
ncbi:ParA family protein [Peredibacter sp. HCB2-198]|uniref:ParA family protein n=1 Tax=Peredibacter sp. HCB2-198 TaxID=3383025 RepID=UPI0038B602F9